MTFLIVIELIVIELSFEFKLMTTQVILFNCNQINLIIINKDNSYGKFNLKM